MNLKNVSAGRRQFPDRLDLGGYQKSGPVEPFPATLARGKDIRGGEPVPLKSQRHLERPKGIRAAETPTERPVSEIVGETAVLSSLPAKREAMDLPSFAIEQVLGARQGANFVGIFEKEFRWRKSLSYPPGKSLAGMVSETLRWPHRFYSRKI